jgi:hypothetical protein
MTTIKKPSRDDKPKFRITEAAFSPLTPGKEKDGSKIEMSAANS